MSIDCSAFSKSVKKRSNRSFASLALLVLLSFSLRESSAQTSAPSVSPSAAIVAGSSFNIQVVQKNPNGNHYNIGDRIALYIEIPQALQNQSSSYEIKPTDSSKKIEELGWFLDPQVNFISGNLRFVVSPIQTGPLILPSLTILNQDKTTLGQTSPWEIQVQGQTLAPDQQEKKPEYLPLVTVGLATKIWLIIFASMILIGALFFFVYKKWKKKKSIPPLVAPKPAVVEPDHVLALKYLNELYTKYPFSTESLKPISFGVSEILKNYFSKQFNIDAREATTQEMMSLLKGIGLPPANLKAIELLFSDLDLVKFTKKENYTHFGETQYREFKLKAEMLIQKWAESIPGGVK